MALRRLLPEPQLRARADVSLAIINIVLLLIFFFLATGQLMNARGDTVIELAETVDLPIEALPDPTLVVADDGTLTLNGNPVAPELLGTALADEPLLHVLIARTAPASRLIEVISQADLADKEIRLVTIHRSGERP